MTITTIFLTSLFNTLEKLQKATPKMALLFVVKERLYYHLCILISYYFDCFRANFDDVYASI